MIPGQLLDGRFRIERQAASGGMGVVLRAHDLETDAAVAIKVVKGDRSTSARFQREARVLAQLTHPAIVRYVAHGVSAGSMYLAMEWLDGEDLAERLTLGPLAVADALHLARRLADALAAAHARGIVHRDLKPGNVFLPGGSVREAKLLDFGIARVAAASLAVTSAGAVLGTPGYMAPEQVRGDAVIDARADVFSLGCVVFECVAGRPVFVGTSTMALLTKILMEDAPRVSELRADVPPALDELVARMLSKDAAERFADGAAVRDAIARIVDGGGIAEESGPPKRTSAVTRGEQHIVSVVIAATPKASARPVTEVLGDEESTPRSSLAALASLASGSKDGARTTVGLAATELAEPAIVPALDAAARFGAHVDRLADGTIVATLHGTATATDQAAEAARCALVLRRLVPDVPIVLATGRAVFAGRLPIGQVIEHAANMMREIGRAAPSHVVHIDETTAGLLPSRFDVHSGELFGETRSADAARTVLGRPTRFVGRDAEMGTLVGLYSQVEADGVARAAIITGAPGLGKSRLREELLSQLERRDPPPAIWLGSAELLGAGVPLGVVARLVRHGLGVAEGAAADRGRIVEHVRGRVADADVPRVATFLAELVGLPLDAAPALSHAEAQLRAARREPPLMAEQTRRALVEVLRAECGARPIVLVLEDAHWGDAPTMKAIDAALRDLSECPLLVLAFARPDIEEAFPGLWGERAVLRVALGNLPARAAERLARDVVGPAATAESVHALVTHAAGNPFFLEELLRAFVAGTQGTMPETLVAIVQKRIEALPEDARRVLRAASVYGPVFWREGVRALLAGAVGLDVEACLAALVDREVVVRHVEPRLVDRTEYAFRHALVRDAAYQMLPDADRIVAHRFAGEWLDAAGETNRALLADHFERGEDRVRATHNYALAAAQALHAEDLEAALRLAKRGLDIAGDESATRGKLHLVRAETHHWRAEYAEASAEAAEALRLLDHASDDWYAASGIAVGAAAFLGRVDEALAHAGDLSRAASEPPGAAFLVAAAQCVAFLPSSSTTDALLARLDVDHIDDPLLLARTAVARGMRAQASGRPTLVLAHFSEALQWFEQAGHARGARAARQNVGYALTELGRHEDAERILRDVLEEAERAGVMTTVAWARMHLGIVVGRLGRTSEALALEGKAAELARKQGSRRLEAEASLVTASIFEATGAADLAERHARTALDLGDTQELRAAALAALAVARVRQGDAEGARAAADEALAIVEARTGADDAELAVRLAHAEALDAAGERAAARAQLAAAKELLVGRAATIQRHDVRDMCLRGVPVNARILHLDEEWSRDDT